MNQFKAVEAWRCAACGRLLKTQRGMKRHSRWCQYTEPVIDGQTALFEDMQLEERHNGRDKGLPGLQQH